MKKILLVGICFAAICSCKKRSQETNSPEALQIETTVLKQKELFEVPGLAVGMIKNDTVIYADAHGVQGLDTGDTSNQMRNFFMVFFLSVLLSCSSDDENPNGLEPNDLIIGTWTELGGGNVLDDGTDQFSEYDYFCVTLGRFSFQTDGSFRIETFDGPDDGCFSTGVLTGTWENQGNTYLISVVTDTSNESEAGQEANIQIDFPTTDRMQWIFQVGSNGIDYEYEIYTRVE